MYYRNAQSALVVYDLTKPTSLVKAKHWVAELQRQASPGIVIALVGNKVDLTKTGSDSADSSATDTTINIDNGAEEQDDQDSATAAAAAATADGDARKISTKEGRDYAEEESLLFFETSAKSGANVQEVFTAIANAIPETQMKNTRGAAAGGAGGAGAGTQAALGSDRVNLAGGREGPKDGCAC